MFDQFTQKSHGFFIAILTIMTLWMAVPGLSSLPVIDRDEARYTQATVQMVESGDYLNIRFQDRARNKKPAGIYWLQAAPVAAMSEPGERVLWAHRLPSVLGFLMTVLATYVGALAFLSRPQAFIAGAIMACSVLMVFEGHIAKTDAMLCGLCTVGLAALLHLRTAPHKVIAFIFWLAMGGALMIKGPILPALVILTLTGLALWERDTTWFKHIISWPGIIAGVLMTVPWGLAIWAETDGAFFRDAVGGDLAPKLAGGQEKHGAPPGYYTLTLPLLFWPGSLLLFSALAFTIKNARQHLNTALGSHLRLLLMWAIPFWIVLEIVPTKLPNYLLPIYPALAIMASAALPTLINHIKALRIGAVLYGVISLLLAALVTYALWLYGTLTPFVVIISIVAAILALVAAIYWFKNQAKAGLILTGLSALMLMPMTYQFILPKLDTLFVSERMADALKAVNIDLPRHSGTAILSPQFTEPSLVYYLGTDIKLGDKITDDMLMDGTIILLDKNRKDTQDWQQKLGCFTEIGHVSGLNYSKGDDVIVTINRIENCR